MRPGRTTWHESCNALQADAVGAQKSSPLNLDFDVSHEARCIGLWTVLYRFSFSNGRYGFTPGGWSP